MSAKTQALVKELAILFVKYNLADWLPVVEELEKGGRGKLAESVRELAAVPRVAARPKMKVAKKAPKKILPAATVPYSPERTKYLEPLLRALKDRVVAPTAHEMRELYLSIGIKEAYPKRREDAAEAIVLRLDKLPEAQFQKVLANVVGEDDENDRQPDDYARWFSLIIESNR